MNERIKDSMSWTPDKWKAVCIEGEGSKKQWLLKRRTFMSRIEEERVWDQSVRKLKLSWVNLWTVCTPTHSAAAAHPSSNGAPSYLSADHRQSKISLNNGRPYTIRLEWTLSGGGTAAMTELPLSDHQVLLSVRKTAVIHLRDPNRRQILRADAG